MSIGDVNSTERGSGARYNEGKPDLSLLPLWMVASYLEVVKDVSTRDVAVMRLLGYFQNSGDFGHLRKILDFYGTVGLRDAARVFAYGKQKYAAWNWAKGMPWSVVLASAARHCVSSALGEIDDPESGLPHSGHLMCNVVMLLQYEHTYSEGNDLPPPGMLSC